MNSPSFSAEVRTQDVRVMGYDLGFVPLLDGNIKYREVSAFSFGIRSTGTLVCQIS